MATEKQKLELSRLKQRAFNPSEDQKLVADMLLKLAAIGDEAGISSTDLTAVPGSFADLAAVQTYLATLIPEIESRLDAIESKVNSIITNA